MQDGCGRPMIAKKQSVSLGGVADTYCTINEEVQTCDTILRFQRDCGSNENCAGGGYCVSKQCTYECKATEECLGDTECKAFVNMKMTPAICAP